MESPPCLPIDSSETSEISIAVFMAISDNLSSRAERQRDGKKAMCKGKENYPTPAFAGRDSLCALGPWRGPRPRTRGEAGKEEIKRLDTLNTSLLGSARHFRACCSSRARPFLDSF
jgi:hypothetical protein